MWGKVMHIVSLFYFSFSRDVKSHTVAKLISYWSTCPSIFVSSTTNTLMFIVSSAVSLVASSFSNPRFVPRIYAVVTLTSGRHSGSCKSSTFVTGLRVSASPSSAHCPHTLNPTKRLSPHLSEKILDNSKLPQDNTFLLFNNITVQLPAKRYLPTKKWRGIQGCATCSQHTG